VTHRSGNEGLESSVSSGRDDFAQLFACQSAGRVIFDILIAALNAPSPCAQGLRRNGTDRPRTDARIEFAGIRVTCPDPVEGFASSLVLIRVHLLVGP
jgi:hypothetical protein